MEKAIALHFNLEDNEVIPEASQDGKIDQT